MKSIFTFVPAFGHMIQAATVQSLVALVQSFNSKGIAAGFTTMSYPDIAELRNMAISIFYDGTPFSHILFVDADMGFAPEVVHDMLLLDEPVVGTLYPKKTLPIEYAASGNGQAQAQTRGYFIEVGGFGMGCALIRRDAITTMIEKMPEIVDTNLAMHNAKQLLDNAGVKRLFRMFDPIYGPSGKVSEDLSFCERWRGCGGMVWASVGHVMTHVGLYSYAGKYLDVLNNPNAVPHPDTVRPEPVKIAAE